MTELYLITRLDIIHKVCETGTILSLLCAIACGIGVIIMFGEKPSFYPTLKKTFIGSLISMGLFGLLLCFIPTTYEAMLICGGGSALDYYKENETLQGIPDKVVEYVDSVLTKKLEGEK